MDKQKVTFIKERETKKIANKNAKFFENAFSQNPIKAKLGAFCETKKNIKIKDLF